jgi:hypothetical protein
VKVSDPLLRVIPFADAPRYSPWPARLLGADAWQKPSRPQADVIAEYNDGWYRRLLDLWDAFAERLQPDTGTAAAQKFFYQVANTVAADVEKNKAVYNSSQAAYLFSIGDEFLIGDLTLGTMIHWDVIVRYVDRQLAGTGIRTIVEPGCGTGVNLFNLYTHLDLDAVVGGDVCTNAVTLATRIAETLRIPARFQDFDYAQPQALQEMTRGLDRYALLTCHSIEQIQIEPIAWLERIGELERPPAMVIHCEPVVAAAEPSVMGQLCQQYAQQNRYNVDLLPALRRAEEQGLLEILDYQQRVFGFSAFNPTSLISWRPATAR